MGFFDNLFGGEKKEKKVNTGIQREHVNVDEVISAIEKKGTNVTGETGGFENYIYIKPIELNSDVDIDAGRNELMRRNLVVFDAKNIINNKALYSTLLTALSSMVADAHGEVRRIAEDKFLAVPAGYKFVSRPFQESE